MSRVEYNSKYMRQLRLRVRRRGHTGKPSCCGDCWRNYNCLHMRKKRAAMAITEINRTIVRRITTKMGDRAVTVVIYIQPDGLVVFRQHRGRKRYAISVAEAMARAMKIGPVDGIFAGLLDIRSKPRSKKP